MKRLTWDRLFRDVTLLIETTQQGDVGAGNFSLRCRNSGKMVNGVMKMVMPGKKSINTKKVCEKVVSFLQI